MLTVGRVKYQILTHTCKKNFQDVRPDGIKVKVVLVIKSQRVREEVSQICVCVPIGF